jgi:phosphoglycolate phosphatase-like HAD superfamily hydrolase
MSPSHVPWLYPDVPAILDGLQEKGVKLAVASRTPTPHIANAFIDKLDLRHRFCRREGLGMSRSTVKHMRLGCEPRITLGSSRRRSVPVPPALQLAADSRCQRL